jgi:hypothetical protein
MTFTKLALLYMSANVAVSHAFMIHPAQQPTTGGKVQKVSTTSLNLQDWVADMIDGELYRQGHKKEFEQEWMQKNRGTMMQVLHAGEETSPFMPSNEPGDQDFRMFAKDKILAAKDPARYCADRCVATGNCDVFEDM